MLLETLVVSILRNALTGKSVIRADERAGIIRTGQKFLTLFHPLTNFEIQKHQKNLNLMVFIQEIIYLK